MNLKKAIFSAFSVLAFAGTALAGERNDVPSCYEHSKINSSSYSLSRELTVIVDQTVEFDKNLINSTYNNIVSYIQPGDRVRLIKMSAYVKDSYIDLLWNGVLEPDLPEKVRYNTGKRNLSKFDKCLKQQKAYVEKKIAANLKEVFFNKPEKLPNTELMGSLSIVSRDVIKHSKIPDKSVLIVSDMIENSGLLSFYGGELKQLNIQSALAKVEQAGFLGDFSGSKVYIIGGGYVPDNKKTSYTDQRSMNNLREFWGNYLESSNAKLIAFGQPNLLRQLGEF